MEIFGHAVVNGVKTGLLQTYSDSMTSVVLPAYEKANAELFRQLYDLFTKGTIACKLILINFFVPMHLILCRFKLKTLFFFLFLIYQTQIH